jgi:hypothetical protein
MSNIVRGSASRRACITALVGVFGVVGVLGTAQAASAKAPTGDFAVFSQCPRFTAEVVLCLYSQTKSGEVTLSEQTVPIAKTITLQGGIRRNEATEAESFVGALNGETLSKTPQKVPGGLAGLVKCNEISNFLERAACELVFENGVTGVNATTELARPASEIGINTNNLINEEGAALTLPLKVHLENPFLGSECYVGSSVKPLTLKLTTGTTTPPPPNKPIKGKVGEIFVKDESTFLELPENTVVDNAFSAPEATGCGGLFAFLIDPIIDSKIGLPSAAGKNTAIQNNVIREATGEAVIASEK